MSGLFGPGKRVETGLFDPQQFTQRLKDRGLWPDPDKYPPGTMLAVTSCKVVEVLVKDDTSVKKGDPLFVLYRPLPPPPTTPLSPFSPLPEYLKIQIKESLEQCQQHQSATIVDNTPSMPTRLLHHNVDAAQLLVNFNKFDIVADYSDHLFSAQSSPKTQRPPFDWFNKIQEDRRILMECLPDTIFVRGYESRMDILRAAIIGQKGTPYHDGLFFFDVCFPINYPDSPPLVRYHSGVPGISPHLNKCGDVCLVLCNELARQEHMWIPGTSNMLQLLVSIQDLILNAMPYFNTLGTARSTISLIQERKSFLFNENTVVRSLETMVYTMNKPPKNFEDLVLGHFHTRVHDILMACKGYIEGQQVVGCLVSDSNHAPSIKFKKDVTSCIKPLVKAFDKIGAKEAQEYLYLTEEKSASPANVPTPVNEGINDAAHKKRKVEEDINPAAKKERKVVVVEETSDPTEKEGKVDEDVIDALILMKKVAEEIIAVVNENNKVVVDEGTNDSGKKESKVPDTDIYPLHARFTIRASFDCVIAKVLVSAGTEVEKGQPLYVMGPRRTEDILLNISSRAPSKESKVEYLMIHKILLMNRRSHVGIFSMEDVSVDHQQQLEDSSPMARGLGNEEDDVLKSFENFRKFDYVTEISDHFFSTQSSALNQPSKEWADMIHEDWTILEKHLPDTIFVRVDESRIDLLRAVIIGPQGTPYRDGLFFFDVCFPRDYPSSPPLVHYHSGGFCINPNLYKCGKVDLSLPKTIGSQERMWVPGTSTILHLLVSIQNRILTTNPIYNDFSYAIMKGFVYGKLFSACYNENIIVKSLKTMVHVMNKPPKDFEDFVLGHFRNHVRNVMLTCKRKTHSIMFKDDLNLCMKLLVAAFNKIGAKVPEEFLPKA